MKALPRSAGGIVAFAFARADHGLRFVVEHRAAGALLHRERGDRAVLADRDAQFDPAFPVVVLRDARIALVARARCPSVPAGSARWLPGSGPPAAARGRRTAGPPHSARATGAAGAGAGCGRHRERRLGGLFRRFDAQDRRRRRTGSRRGRCRAGAGDAARTRREAAAARLCGGGSRHRLWALRQARRSAAAPAARRCASFRTGSSEQHQHVQDERSQPAPARAGASCRSPTLRAAKRSPDLLRCHRHFDVLHAALGERVEHRVHDRGRRADGAELAARP